MQQPKVLAYYFPDWHRDPRNEAWKGRGWDEWELVRSARPRFEGHRQPRVPLRGYTDEADPAEAAEQVTLAVDYGVDGFLFDFYWYEDGPYLNRALDEGFLRADNTEDVEFALMWANHELTDIFPFDPSQQRSPTRLKDGAISLTAFQSMARHVIHAYFTQPNYLRVDGKPWFSIYELGTLIAGLGGIEKTREALEWFEAESVRSGFPGLHLDVVIWGIGVLPTALAIEDPSSIVSRLPFASATSYVWVHHGSGSTAGFPEGDRDSWRDDAFSEYEDYARTLAIPFYPNVTVGWDSTPRLAAHAEHVRATYPGGSIWDQSPADFKIGLLRARRFLEEHQYDYPVVTINAWNEWTEGSYLLPDQTNGYAFLDAIREVFGVREGAARWAATRL